MHSHALVAWLCVWQCVWRCPDDHRPVLRRRPLPHRLHRPLLRLHPLLHRLHRPFLRLHPLPHRLNRPTLSMSGLKRRKDGQLPGEGIKRFVHPRVAETSRTWAYGRSSGSSAEEASVLGPTEEKGELHRTLTWRSSSRNRWLHAQGLAIPCHRCLTRNSTCLAVAGRRRTSTSSG